MDIGVRPQVPAQCAWPVRYKFAGNAAIDARHVAHGYRGFAEDLRFLPYRFRRCFAPNEVLVHLFRDFSGARPDLPPTPPFSDPDYSTRTPVDERR
jgi:hypothetical protein